MGFNYFCFIIGKEEGKNYGKLEDGIYKFLERKIRWKLEEPHRHLHMVIAAEIKCLASLLSVCVSLN